MSLSILEPPDTTWSPFTFPDQVIKGRLLADSAGRLHNVQLGRNSFTYRITSDGGRNWSEAVVPLPESYEAIMPTFERFWDFKANATLDMSVVSMYARNTKTAKDQNLVFVLSTSGDRPRFDKVLWLGDGDKAFGASAIQTDRLDFITLGILPNGRVVTTFLDNGFPSPALAISASPVVPTASTDSATDPIPTPSPSPSPSPEPTAPTPSPNPSTSPSSPPDHTPPEITAVHDGPDPFGPNGDGRRDETTHQDSKCPNQCTRECLESSTAQRTPR